MFFADVSTEEEALNTINDVLSDLGLSETPAAAEEGAPSVKGCDSVQDPLCSLQMSETQSQSVDGTEPVTQPEDVLFIFSWRTNIRGRSKKILTRRGRPALRKVLMFLDLFMQLSSLLKKTCCVVVMARLSLLRRKSRRLLRGS